MFNFKKENHRKAYEILSSIKSGDKSDFCINRILEVQDENQEIKNLIESTIESCLKDIQVSNQKATGTPSKNIEVVEDEIDIMDGAAVVRTLTSSTPVATHIEADQITDFGIAQTILTFDVYQMSAQIGRGIASAYSGAILWAPQTQNLVNGPARKISLGRP